MQALPLNPDAARCTFSKRRGELVVEWPCGSDHLVDPAEKEALEKAAEEKVAAEQAAAGEVALGTAAAEDAAEAKAAEKEAAEMAVAEKGTAEKVAVDMAAEGKASAEVAAAEEAAAEQPVAESEVAATGESPPAEVNESGTAAEAALTAEEWRARGNAAVKSGDHETAIACYSSGITQAGIDSEAEALLRSNRALCLHKLGRYEEAVCDAERCVTLKPEFVKGYLRGAMALRAAGRPTEALALLKRAPVNDEACALAAEVRPEAEAAERARIDALPEAERMKEEGNVLFRKGLFEAAAEKYTEALSLCKELEGSLALSIRNNRAACYHQISDFHAVIKDTNFVLEREPRNCKALLRRMLALEPLERYEQALQDARGVLIQDPRNEMANKVQHRLGKLVRDLSRANGGA